MNEHTHNIYTFRVNDETDMELTVKNYFSNKKEIF